MIVRSRTINKLLSLYKHKHTHSFVVTTKALHQTPKLLHSKTTAGSNTNTIPVQNTITLHITNQPHCYSIRPRNFNHPDIIRPVSHLLSNSNSKQSVIHRSLNLIRYRILRQLKPAHKLAVISADLKYSVVINENYHLIAGKPRKIGLEHVGFEGFFPVDLGLMVEGEEFPRK